MQSRFKVTFAGKSIEFDSLLEAMEYRKEIIACGAHAHAVSVWERGIDGWVSFDAEAFLEALKIMLAPAR